MSSSRFFVFGVLFAMIWSSASVSAKIGMKWVQPLMLYEARFFIAAIALFLLAHGILRKRLPKGKEWTQLALFGLLNVTVALGLFALAIHEVAAGIGALQVGINPLVISVLTAIVAGRKVRMNEVIALILGLLGVVIAVYPLLMTSYATIRGLVYLGLSTIAYSSAAVFYSKIDWKLDKLTINGWQAFFGGLFLLPLALLSFKTDLNQINSEVSISALWLGLGLSGFAVYLWLALLKVDSVRASLFLFLCPVFGFMYAYFILDEPFTLYTFTSLVVVLSALYIGRK
ncbi:DMT family transporter [Jiulongibacter sp. NS-SX5]|uniref:DMT family transporter n=1 Tax=Jiulongibacter sp. NS-SX5 TaxID=3463854 RepID=UPI00405A28F2